MPWDLLERAGGSANHSRGGAGTGLVDHEDGVAALLLGRLVDVVCEGHVLQPYLPPGRHVRRREVAR